MWLLLAFLAVPLIEIALFIQVGGVIGLFPTLAIVVLTAVIGSWLVRSQGGQALARLRTSIDRLEDPTAPLADGAMILFAGALLLTPGFFTDTVGFLLLIPQTRDMVRRYVARHVQVRTQAARPHRDPGFVDLQADQDYRDVTPREGSGKSGWTRSG